MTDKSYTLTDNYNIGQYPKAVYELYFNSKLKQKWVNSSRSENDMIKEILASVPVPSSITHAYIIKTQSQETSIAWEYIKQSKPIFDKLNGETYPNYLIAENKTGVKRQSIINQCNQSFYTSQRFVFA